MKPVLSRHSEDSCYCPLNRGVCSTQVRFTERPTEAVVCLLQGVCSTLVRFTERPTEAVVCLLQGVCLTQGCFTEQPTEAVVCLLQDVCLTQGLLTTGCTVAVFFHSFVHKLAIDHQYKIQQPASDTHSEQIEITCRILSKE